MVSQHYLDDVGRQLRKLKQGAERSLAQLSDEEIVAAFGEDENSIAIIVKHMAGNMRSRWTDFLTTDGEKPDRHRDREFLLEKGDSREELMRGWQRGWQCLFDALATVTTADLERTITVRGEPHTVLEAINRQMTHYAYHVGQIVLLARHLRGDSWQWLSIPPGKSAQYDVSKDGVRYDVDGKSER